MCARRFLVIVFILTLLAVAAAVAIFQFGNRVLIKSAIPRGHYVAPVEAGPHGGLVFAKLGNDGLLALLHNEKTRAQPYQHGHSGNEAQWQQ